MFNENDRIVLCKRYVNGYFIYYVPYENKASFSWPGTADEFIYNLSEEPNALQELINTPEETQAIVKLLDEEFPFLPIQEFFVVGYNNEDNIIVVYEEHPACFYEMQKDIYHKLTEEHITELKEARDKRPLSEPYQCFIDNGELIIY